MHRPAGYAVPLGWRSSQYGSPAPGGTKKTCRDGIAITPGRRSFACLLPAAFLLALAGAANGATFEIPPGNVPALKVAIETANANGEDDLINLAPGATYSIHTFDNSTSSNGANGLPVINADGGRSLTINGRGATIACIFNPSTPFRIFQIGLNATLTINGLTLTGGRAVTASSTGGANGGGAILNDRGNLTLVDCLLFQNGATNPSNSPLSVGGGAIFNNAGILALHGCTFHLNSVGSNPMGPAAGEYSGGAIYNADGTVTAQVSTFANNSATVQPGTGGTTFAVTGGAIANATRSSSASALVRINNCTFSGNNASAPQGPPVVQGTTMSNRGSGATITIGSSIVSGIGSMLWNSGGSITSAGYNLTNGDGQGVLTAASDQLRTDPQLRLIANNGGLTGTCALAITSPAIDKGKRDAIPELAVTTDQRGVARPYDWPGVSSPGAADGSDIGAFEVTPTLLVTTVDDRDDGTCDAADCTLREAMTAANAQANLDTIGFAPGVTGTINLTSRLPELSKNVEIGGPGADVLTLRRESTTSFRIFLVSDLIDNDLGPQVWLRGLTLANGQAAGSGSAGGGIYNDFGTLRIGECTLQGNNAGNGAAIYNFRGTVTLTDSTLSGNTATGFGGALFNAAAQGPATLNLSNSTVAGNTAGRGAAIYNNGSTGTAKVNLLNCTFSGNNASAFGGIYAEGSTANVTLRNTILAAASGSPNFILANSATVTSQGNNLSSDAAGGGPDTAPGGVLNQSGDKRNTDPRLDPNGLAANGGTTPTLALLADSPAIDAANSTEAPPLDQRGYGRAGAADIGAFEFGGIEPPPPPPPPTPTPTPTPTATPEPTATPVPNRFANISTRLRVDTGDNVLIGGFIVTGSMQKRVIVRALGPSLPLDDKLEDPILELYDGSGNLLATNDNWQDAPNRQEIIDSTIPPTNDLESAILQDVNLGAHTAVVSGVNGGTGVGLVEVYDLGNNQDSRLANISTRGRVLTADDVMIGGLIATGSHAQRVIIRAIGPSLDVAGRLEDPFLELYDGDGNLITSNDNWKDTQQAEIEATTIQPSNDLESAIVTFMPPAAYTAVVRGVNETTGVAVVEVYALQ